MDIKIETKPVVTLTLTIEEAAALAAAARNFVLDREIVIQHSGSGTVNFKNTAKEDLERVGMAITGALDYKTCEAVWDYANLERPEQPTPMDAGLDPDEDDDNH
jgi:hypothetical protein